MNILKKMKRKGRISMSEIHICSESGKCSEILKKACPHAIKHNPLISCHYSCIHNGNAKCISDSKWGIYDYYDNLKGTFLLKSDAETSLKIANDYCNDKLYLRKIKKGDLND